MTFVKHTQSEGHEVVPEKEKDLIEDHTRKAGKERVSKLSDLEREKLLTELDELQN